MQQLYKHKIIHRDLKLENILLSQNVIKISDFGLSKQLEQFQYDVNSVKCGTPCTMAPEILLANTNYPKYTNKADVWSLGIILHELVYKKHPFDMDFQKMKKQQRVFIKKKYQIIESFIDKSLVFNPKNRIYMEEVFNHQINICQDINQQIYYQENVQFQSISKLQKNQQNIDKDFQCLQNKDLYYLKKRNIKKQINQIEFNLQLQEEKEIQKIKQINDQTISKTKSNINYFFTIIKFFGALSIQFTIYFYIKSILK
ncbi:protein kinase domain protein [Ichthyophthirius multifiliis]|uniref:Protein kinase domain protein n=1 Tax=Ichthyophthirius multifiliis TaxID=5932 RepID=G0QKF6_ICHMU|nr:protein kinase domain protein [Ichthyophthirius multifiliis]EGR34297.1 protein kinase domain protein [Ichthyophthirius multifiliis]|eukprot:XP_004039601.1 protein kinase domain protein [Ichthyophthirius multifiliis]